MLFPPCCCCCFVNHDYLYKTSIERSTEILAMTKIFEMSVFNVGIKDGGLVVDEFDSVHFVSPCCCCLLFILLYIYTTGPLRCQEKSQIFFKNFHGLSSRKSDAVCF